MKSKILSCLMFGMILIAGAILASASVSAAYVYTTNWFYSGNPVSSVRAIVYNCPNDGCTTLGTERFDETSGTNSITISYPVPAPNWGYATYWLSPGYRVMQDNWKPAGSGSSTANLNFQKYASCSAPINSVSAASSVNEGQALSITVNVDSALPAPSHAPYARPADADLIRDYFSARTNVTIMIRDASNNLIYTASSDNYILENDDRNFAFSWTPNYNQSGSYTITARTDVIDSKCAAVTVVTSSPRSVTVNNAPNPDNHAPVLGAIGSKIVLNNTLLQFTVSATDPDGDSLTYSASPLPSGAVFNSGTGAFSWTPTSAQVGVYNVNFSVSDGSLVDYEIVQITVTDNNNIDFEAPQYSDLSEDPESPAGYTEEGYEFSGTWTDNVGMDKVWLVFNGVTYYASEFADNVYSVEIDEDLAMGNYTYRWYANDTSGNVNVTEEFVYSILQGTPNLQIVMSPGTTVNKGATTTVTGTGCPSQLACTLYRDGVAVSNPDVQKLAAGTYTYVYNTTGNENFTSLSITATLTVKLWYDDGSDEDDDDSHEKDTITITDEQLANGYSLWMLIGEKIKFEYCGSPYYIKLKDIDNDEAIFTITPEVISQFSLGVKESIKIDLDEDGVDDITFKVEDLGTTKAKVYIKRLGAEVCKSDAETRQTTYVARSDGSVLLNPKSSFDTMSYLPWILAFGILILLLLAILIAALGRKKKRVAVQIRR